MRRILAASLLLPSMFVSTTAVASTPAPAVNLTHSYRISTGVVPPTVLQAVKVELPTATLANGMADNAKVVVSVLVGANGKAQSVHVVQPYFNAVDEQVIAAVRKFKFTPATLDNKAIAMSMNLTVVLQR